MDWRKKYRYLMKVKAGRSRMKSFEADEDVNELLEMIGNMGLNKSRIINQCLRENLPRVIDRMIKEQEKMLDRIKTMRKSGTRKAPEKKENN